GHYSIATIRPGTYILFCDRSGYLQVQSKDSGIPNLSLKPSQQLRDYKIVLAPRAILAGRVIDENGDPVPGATIETVAVPPESVSLMQSMSMLAGQQGTDDR